MIQIRKFVTFSKQLEPKDLLPKCIDCKNFIKHVENDKEFIIEVLERYMKDAAYLIPNKMQESVKVNFPENNFLRLAENSSYSKEYISKLVGWKNK